MENNNQNTNQEENFGIPGVVNTGSFYDNQGNILQNVDVLDESLSGRGSLEDIAKTLRMKDNFVVNDKNYYYKKFSAEDNPSNPQALKRAEIDKLYDGAKKVASYRQDVQDKGITMNQLDYISRYSQLTNVPANILYDDYTTMQNAYTGNYDPRRGKYDHIATEQEFAEQQDYMFVKTDKGLQKVAKPSLKDMEKMFTDKGMVIITTLDKDNGYAPVLIAKSSSEFVPQDLVYSTEFGAKRTYGNKFSEFFRGIYDGAVWGTLGAMQDMKNFIGNATMYDSNYLFDKGFDQLDGHIKETVQALADAGQLNAAERLMSAYENQDLQNIKENLSFAYASLEPSIGRSLMRKAQPVKWQEFDKAYEATYNFYNSKKKPMSMSTMNGAGIGAFIARQGETVGYLLPQIAIGLATQGMSALPSLGATVGGTVARGAAKALANTVGTSQAFSAFWRTGIESGIDRDTLIKIGFWAIPATYVSEALLNGWMFKNMDDATFITALKEPIERSMKEFTKKFGTGTAKKATESEIRKFSFDMVGKIMKNESFRKWINSGSYLSDLAKANVSEVIQENFEEGWYNYLQKYHVDNAAPEYYETGKGKFGTESMFGDFSEVTLGTIFATTLVQGITGGVPRMIRRANGVPDTKTEQDKQRRRNYAILKEGAQPYLDFASKEWSKESNIFGVKNVHKIKDVLLGNEIDPNQFVVPENDFLQKHGLQAGSVIEDLATMRFVEFVMDVQAAQSLKQEMNLSELDMKVLSIAGFNDEISLSKSIEAFGTMKEKKAEIEALLQSQEVSEGQEPLTIEKLNQMYSQYQELSTPEQRTSYLEEAPQAFPKFVSYKEAQKAFEYYSKPEEGTKYSQAANDLVKRNRALVNQVENKFKSDKGLTGDLTVEQKNDPDVVKEYFAIWEETVKKEFQYENLRALYDNVMQLSKQEDARRDADENALVNNTEFKALEEEFNKLEETMNESIAGGQSGAIKDALRGFGKMGKTLSEEMRATDSMMSMDNLNSLKDRYSVLWQQAQQALGVLKSQSPSNQKLAELNTEMDQEVTRRQTERDAIKGQIDTLQIQLDNLNQVDTSTFTEEQLAEHNTAINDINEQIKSVSESLVSDEDIRDEVESDYETRTGVYEAELESYDPVNYFQSLYEEISDTYKFAPEIDSDGNLVATIPAMSSEEQDEVTGGTTITNYLLRDETSEQYEARKQSYLDKIRNARTKSFLVNYVTSLYDALTEIKTYIDSQVAGDNEYATKYPNGVLNESNIRANVGDVNRRLEGIKYFGNAFTVAKAINGDKSFNEHSSSDEKIFVAELANDISNEQGMSLQKLFEDAGVMLKYTNEKIGEVELLNQKKLLHMHTVATEMRLQSISVIVTADLKATDGTQLIAADLLQAYNDLSPLEADILTLKGQYTPQQMEMLAKRRKVVDNILSDLQRKKHIVFNDTNKPKVFEIFEKLRIARSSEGVNSAGQIFTGNDMETHIGEDGPLTNITREKFLSVPLLTKDANGNITYNFEGTYTDKEGKVHFSLSNSHVLHQLREHLNILTWIGSAYSVNDINKLRRIKYENSELIETSEQESVINSSIAFFSTPKEESVLGMLWDYLDAENTYTDTKKTFYIQNYMTNALTIGGDYGTGKTQFVLKRALEYLINLEGADNRSIKNIVFVGITEKLRDVHKETFSGFAKTHDAKFISMRGQGSFIDNIADMNTDSGTLYVIDEASILGDDEYLNIGATFRNKGAKILFLGDMFQMKSPDSRDMSPRIMRSTMTTTLLTHQFSSVSPLLRALAESTRPAIRKDKLALILYPKVSERLTARRKIGARYFADRLEVYNSFAGSTNENKVIVFANESDYQDFITRYPATKTALEDFNKKGKIYFAIPEKNGNTERLLQGLREEEVYLAFSFDDFAKSTINVGSRVMGSALYTGIGRASHWVGLIDVNGARTMNVSEAEALSLGTDMGNNEFLDKVRENLKPLNDIWFNSYEATEKAKTAGPPANSKTINKVVFNNGELDVTYTRKNNTISYEVEGDIYTHKFDDTNDDATAEEFIRQALKTHDLKKTTSSDKANDVSQDFVNIKGSVIQQDTGIVITDRGVVTKGTVDSVEVTSTGAVLTITTTDNTVKTVSVTLNSDVDTSDNVDERTIEEQVSVESAHKFRQHPGRRLAWGSSASVIDNAGKSVERTRAINNAIVGINGLTGYSLRQYTNVSYSGENNITEFTPELVALVLKIDVSDAALMDKLNTALLETLYYDEWVKVPKNDQKAVETFLGAKDGVLVVGTISQPHVPSMNNKTYELVRANNMTREQIENAYNIAINNSPSSIVKTSLEYQRDYNLSLWDYHNDPVLKASGDMPITVERGKRKIEYAKGDKNRGKVSERFGVNDYPGIVFNAVPRYRHTGRMILGYKLPGDLEGEMVVSMPMFRESDESVNQVMSRITNERNTLSDAAKKITEQDRTDKKSKDILNTAFSGTTLYRLIRSNISLIKSAKAGTIEAEIAALISIEERGKTHINLKETTEKEMQENFNKLQGLFSAAKLKGSSMFDFLDKVDGKFQTHDGRPIIDVLYTHAQRINNRQFYAMLDKPIVGSQPASGTTTNNVPAKKQHTGRRKPSKGSALEQKQYSSGRMIQVEKARQEVAKYLGEEYVNSDYFLLNDGYIRDGRISAAGMVEHGVFMTLAQLQGKVHASTPSHEAFHIIYRNFVDPLVKRQLDTSARRIAQYQDNQDIAGNEEEWLARDFSRTRVSESYPDAIKQDVSLLERFKNFIRGLVNRFNGVYRAEKRLKKFYDDIAKGKYINRVGELKITHEANIAYQEEIEALQDDMNDIMTGDVLTEKFSEKRKNKLYEANVIKQKYEGKVTAEAMTNFETKVRSELIQNSYLGNIMSSEQNNLGRTLSKTINESSETLRDLFGDIEIPIHTSQGPVPMKVSDVVAQKLQSGIVMNSESGVDYADARYYIDMYTMYNDKDLVAAIIQLSVPGLDIINANIEWGSPASERFDWSKQRPDDYFNDMGKLYLSMVPYIDASGQTSDEGYDFIPFNKVSSLMKVIGNAAYNITVKDPSIDLITAMKVFMENIIDNSPYEMFDGVPHYQSEQARQIHSIYNYMFKAKGAESIPNYILNYSAIKGTGDTLIRKDSYMGLLEKAMVLRFNPNVDQTVVDDMINHVINLVGLFSSYYIKNQTKAVYYGYDKMKAIHYNSESWVSISNTIKDRFASMMHTGELQGSAKAFINNNVIFTPGSTPESFSISVKTSPWEAKTDQFLFYNGKNFYFMNEDGAINKDKYIDTEIIDSNYQNLLSVMANIKDVLGFDEIDEAVFVAMLSAKNFDQVTDILRANEVDKAHLSNFMTLINSAYNTPMEFLADYIGSFMVLQYQHAKEYQYNAIIDTDEGVVSSDYIQITDNLTGYIRHKVSEAKKDGKYYPGMEADSVPYNHVIKNFRNRVTEASLFNNVSEELSEESDNDGPDVKIDIQDSAIYENGSNMFPAFHMMASIIQKVKGITNDGSVYTAEGQKAWNVALRSRLNNIIPNIKSDNLVIETITESLGVSRDMNVATIGRKRLDTKDYIDTSIRMFMQEIYKNRNNPLLYVPLMPAADTGKIIYARMKSHIVSMKDGKFSIDFANAAKEVLSIADRIDKEVENSRKTLDVVLNNVRTLLGIKSALTADPKDLNSYYNQSKMISMFIKMSKEAHAKGKFDELKRMFDNSNLKKDIKSIKNKKNGVNVGYLPNNMSNQPLYDVSYQMVDGQMVIVPGNYMFGRIPGYDYLRKTYQENNVPGLSIVGTIRNKIEELKNYEGRTLTKDELKIVDGIKNVLEQMIYKLYRNEFIDMTKMLAKVGFQQTGSQIELNMITDDNQKLRKGKDIDTKSYYTGGSTKFNPQKPLFAYFLMTLFANEAVSAESVSHFSFRNYLDAVKRNGPVHTPGQDPIIDGKVEVQGKMVNIGSMPKKNFIIPYNDASVNGGATYQLIDGKEVITDKGNEVDPENGQAYLNPIFNHFFLRSFGGNSQNMVGDSNMYKTLTNFKRENGSISQIKRADHNITGFDMQSQAYRNMFNRMLEESTRLIEQALNKQGLPSYNLRDKFNEMYDKTHDFDEATRLVYNDIVNQQYYSDGTVNSEGIKVYEAIVNNMVSMMVPNSVQKGAITVVNDFDHMNDDMSIPMAFDIIDNTQTKVIMNPAQDTTTDKMQAFPTQQETFFGATNDININMSSRAYAQIKQKAQDNLINDIVNQISKQKDLQGKDVSASYQFKNINFDEWDFEKLTSQQKAILDKGLEQFINYYKEMVVTNLSTSGQDMAYIKLFLEDVSINIPMMRQKLVQTYLNHINKMIQVRTPGIRLTQTAGEFIEVYEKDGEIYTRNDVVKEVFGSLETLSWTALNDTTTEEVIASNGFKKRKLKDMSPDAEQTSSGEVSMPNVLADKYGHRKDESMREILTANISGKRIPLSEALNNLRGTSTNDRMNMKFWMDYSDSPMIRKAISNQRLVERFNSMLDSKRRIEENEGRPISETDFMSQDLETQKKMWARYDEMQASISDKKLLMTLTNMGVDIENLSDQEKVAYMMAYNQNIRESVTNEAVKLKDVFVSAYEIMLSRVPATFIGSGGVYKAVVFNNTGNVVYVPTGMILRNDSDFDIDALTAYFDAIDDKGYRDNTKVNGYRNQMNNIRKNIMLDKNNQTSLFIKSSVKPINDVVEQKQADSKSKQKEMMNNSLNSIFEAYKRNKAGADGIGIFANTEQSLAYLLTYLNSNKVIVNEKGMLSNILKIAAPDKQVITGPNSLIAKMMGWEQSTLDNAKNNTFGNYGVPEEAVHILAVLTAFETNEYIYDFFNNTHVKSLFQEYSEKSSILTKSIDYDLYVLSQGKASKMLNYMKNEPLTHYNKIHKAKPLTVELKRNETDKLRDNIEMSVDELYGRLKQALLPMLKSMYAPKGLGLPKYFNDKTNDMDEVERWMETEYDGLLSLSNMFAEMNDDVYEGVLEKYNQIIGGLITTYNSPEIKEEIEDIINSFYELRSIYDYVNAYNYIKRIPELEVTAVALYRMSAVMGLRRGLPVLDSDFVRVKQQIELSFGMTLNDFVKADIPSQVNEAKHMAFFELNNETINSMTKDEDQEKRRLLIEKERKVVNELNLPYLVKNMPQLNNSISEYVRQEKIKEAAFIVDSKVSKKLQKRLLAAQNQKAFKYGQQYSDFNSAINDFVLDYFYKEYGTKYNVPTMSLPRRDYFKSWVKEGQNIQLDLSDLYSRQEFLTGFPDFAMELVKNRADIDFLKSFIPETIQIEISETNNLDEVLSSVGDNLFLQYLKYDVKGKYLKLSLNTADLTPLQISRLQDSFAELPAYIQNMFKNYELIRNRMSYRQGSILQIIGVDFYKGDLTKSFDYIHKQINTINNASAFVNVGDISTEERLRIANDLEERLFDFLGASTTFAVRKDLPFFMDDINNPTYVYNYGAENNAKRPIFYKMNQDSGKYEEVFKMSYSLTTSVEQRMMSQVPVFEASISELNDLRDGKTVIKHRGATTLYSLKAKDFRMTQTGILVKVLSKKPSYFTYTKVTDAADMSRFLNEIKNKTEKNMSGVSVVEGTLTYDILSPKKVHDFEVNNNSFLSQYKIKTVDSKGNEITIPAIRNGKYSTIQSIIDEVRLQAILSIDKKREDNKRYTEQRGENPLNNSDTIATYAKNLTADAQQSYSNVMTPEEFDVYQKQVRAAVVYINKSIPVIVKAIVKNNMQEQVKARGNDAFIELQQLITSTTVYGKAIENMIIGVTKYGNTYGPIARMGIREFFGMKEEYAQAENMISTGQETIQVYNDLFNEEKVSYEKAYNHTAKAERKYASTEDVIRANEAIKAHMILKDDNTMYLQRDTTSDPFSNNVARLSNLSNIVETDVNPTTKITQISGKNAEVGTAVDDALRGFFSKWTEHRRSGILGDPSPSIRLSADMMYINGISLSNIATKVAKALEAWGDINGYDTEFITEELWTYDMNEESPLNKRYSEVIAGGSNMNIKGVGTRQDMIVRYRKKGTNEYFDTLVDFKTTSLQNVIPFTYLTDYDKKVIKMWNLKWAIQLEATAAMLINTHGLNINRKVIFPLMKVEGKNTVNGKKEITFALHSSIEKTIDEYIEGKESEYFPLHTPNELSITYKNALYQYIKRPNQIHGYENMKTTIDNSEVFNYCK